MKMDTFLPDVLSIEHANIAMGRTWVKEGRDEGDGESGGGGGHLRPLRSADMA